MTRWSMISSIIVATSAIPVGSALADEPIQDGDPGMRSGVYIDDTSQDNLSGWKNMLTNAMPDKLLTSGRWFDSSPVPRPFGRESELKPFSKEMRAGLRNNSTDALIVIKDGVITQQYLRYGFDIGDIHLIHSTGKVFSSFAIQPIYDQIGADGLNQPLKIYLPKLDSKYFGEATFAHALDMKVGVEWTEDYSDPTTATMLSGSVGGWDPLDPKKGPESWYERMFDFPKYGQHGQTWVYNNAAVIASSFAAAAIAERSFSDLVQDSYNRLGFEDRSWFVSNRLNELSAEGGQALSIRDHAKLGRFMLEAVGSQYVDDVWNEVGDPNDPATTKFLKKYGPLFGADGYKNYWYSLGPDTIMAVGSSGIFLYVDRAKNLVISKYSSFVQGQGAEEFTEAYAIIREIENNY